MSRSHTWATYQNVKQPALWYMVSLGYIPDVLSVRPQSLAEPELSQKGPLEGSENQEAGNSPSVTAPAVCFKLTRTLPLRKPSITERIISWITITW